MSNAGQQGSRHKIAQPDIAVIVRTLRSSLGLTQERFAAKVGVSFSTVNRWENGRGTPSPLARQRIDELQKTIEHKQA